MKSANVQDLWVYPVKGVQGVEVDSIKITELGIVGDRDFAVWEDGCLVDQKAGRDVRLVSAKGRGRSTFRSSVGGVEQPDDSPAEQ